MHAMEKKLVKDNVLGGAVIAVGIAWFIAAALHVPVAMETLPGVGQGVPAVDAAASGATRVVALPAARRAVAPLAA